MDSLTNHLRINFFNQIPTIILDALLTFMALWLAFLLRLGEWYQPSTGQTILFMAAPFITILCLMYMGVYRSVIQFMGHSSLWQLVKATLLSTLTWCVLLVTTKIPDTVPYSVVGIYWLTMTALLGGYRLAFRAFHWAPLKKELKVVIYGAGSAGIQLVSALRTTPDIRPVAFIDDNSQLQGRVISGLQIYAIEDLNHLKKNQQIDEVLLAIPSESSQNKYQIVKKINEYQISVRIIPGLTEIIKGHIKTENIRNVALEDLLGREVFSPKLSSVGQYIEGKTILITGAGGSVGAELCKQLLELQPSQLILLDHSEHSLYQIELELQEILIDSKYVEITPVLGTLLDLSFIQSLFKQHSIDVIYHAAAYKHVNIVEKNRLAGISNNVIGTYNVASVAFENAVSSFVFVSTDKSVRPTNVMGASKRVAELIIQGLQECSLSDNHQLAKNMRPTNFTIVRFGNVLGSSGSVVPKFQEQILRGGPVTVTHKEVTRYFMTLSEATQLVIQAGFMGEGGEVFVLDMGLPVKIDDLARLMVHSMGLTVKDADFPTGDIEIQYTGLTAGEKLVEELSISGSLQTTSHPGILKANEKNADWHSIAQSVKEIESYILQNDLVRLSKLLSQLVDGYKGFNLVDLDSVHALSLEKS